MTSSSFDNEPVRIGEVLAGKYVVERVLGVGGMGVVVAARHTELDQTCALKFVLPSALREGGSAVERFLREARAAARLKSEHVTRVSDFGRLENGAPYIVMEYLEGADLAAVLRQFGPLPISDAAEYIVQACEALTEAHAVGIIHRDLKPQNLFLSRRPSGLPLIKVLDFGISKVSSLEGVPSQLTRTSAMMGSPYYMAPEQMRSSRAVDPRADIWALGVVLYELVTGAVPFAGESVPELCLAVVNDPTPTLVRHRDDLPPGFDDVVARCLEKDPARRFQNAADLAAALAPYAPRARETAEYARLIFDELTGSNGRMAFGSVSSPHASINVTTDGPRVAVASSPQRTTDDAVSRSPAAPSPARMSSHSKAIVAIGALAALGFASAGALWIGTRHAATAPPPPTIPMLASAAQSPTASMAPTASPPPLTPLPSPADGTPTIRPLDAPVEAMASAPASKTPRQVSSSRPTKPNATRPSAGDDIPGLR